MHTLSAIRRGEYLAPILSQSVLHLMLALEHWILNDIQLIFDESNERAFSQIV